MSEVKQQVIDEIIEGIEKLMDLIEDVEKWQDFADRMDKARNGEIGDPVELMEILTDLLEYIVDKIPNDNLKRLVQQLLKIAIGALEAGASLARWILLFRYRRRREAGSSPEDAAKHVTNDKAARVWLRLKEQQDKKGENDEAVEDDGEDVRDAIPDLTFPRDPKPRWPKDHCCAKNDNDKKVPVLNPKTESSAEKLTNHDSAEYKVTVKFEASQPCGIHRVIARVFTRSRVATSGAIGHNPPWVELQRNTDLFRLTRESTDTGTKGTLTLKTAAEVAIQYRIISTCGTSKSQTIKIVNPA